MVATSSFKSLKRPKPITDMLTIFEAMPNHHAYDCAVSAALRTIAFHRESKRTTRAVIPARGLRQAGLIRLAEKKSRAF